MHIPLIVAIVAFLAFVLLQTLDLSTASRANATGLRAYWNRIARWTQEQAV